MPPFFTSQTPIARMDTRLAGSIGDRLGAGIQQGVEMFMAGVEQKRAKDEKKQQDEAALQYAKKFAPNIGMDPNDEEGLKAGIKAFGGGAQFLKFAQETQQQLAQQKYVEQMTKQLALRNAQENAFIANLQDAHNGSMVASGDGGPARFDPQEFLTTMVKSGASLADSVTAAQAFLPPKQVQEPYVWSDPESKLRYLIHGNNTPLLLGPDTGGKISPKDTQRLSILTSQYNRLQSKITDFTYGSVTNLGYVKGNPDAVKALQDQADKLRSQIDEILNPPQKDAKDNPLDFSGITNATAPGAGVVAGPTNAATPAAEDNKIGRFKIVGS